MALPKVLGMTQPTENDATLLRVYAGEAAVLCDTADERATHLARMRAAAAGIGPKTYFCLESAAVLHGLPMWTPRLDRVHLLQSGTGHGRVSRWVHHYRAPHNPPDVTVIDGLPATSLVRTAADLMRRHSFGPALAIADAALRAGASRGALLAGVAGGRGCRHASEAVRRADRRSESPYESLARALMLQHGLPLPQLQPSITSRRGVFIARPDFYWPMHRLVGEFDGAVKYTTLLRPGQAVEGALDQQNARQWALEQRGLRVIRWDAGDVQDGARFVSELAVLLGNRRVDHALCPEAFPTGWVRFDSQRRRRMPWA